MVIRLYVWHTYLFTDDGYGVVESTIQYLSPHRDTHAQWIIVTDSATYLWLGLQYCHLPNINTLSEIPSVYLYKALVWSSYKAILVKSCILCKFEFKTSNAKCTLSPNPWSILAAARPAVPAPTTITDGFYKVKTWNTFLFC